MDRRRRRSSPHGTGTRFAEIGKLENMCRIAVEPTVIGVLVVVAPAVEETGAEESGEPVHLQESTWSWLGVVQTVPGI